MILDMAHFLLFTSFQPIVLSSLLGTTHQPFSRETLTATNDFAPYTRF